MSSPDPDPNATPDPKQQVDPVSPEQPTENPQPKADPPKDQKATLGDFNFADKQKTAAEVRKEINEIPRIKDFGFNDYLRFYENGLIALKVRLEAEPSSQDIVDIHVLVTRLSENIRHERIHGGDQIRQSERSEVLGNLNALTLQVIGIRFEDLCSETRREHLEEHGLPKNNDELQRWFYEELNDLGRAFVLATTVLHGAPLNIVSQSARQIDVIYRKTNANMQEQTNIPLVSTAQILRETHTVTRNEGGNERVFWADEALQDLTQSFIAFESLGVGLLSGDKGFIAVLQQWCLEKDNERSWRAGRLLAYIWWSHSQNELRRQAQVWANRTDAQGLQSVSVLLYGAFEIEQRRQIPQDTSIVLDLLHDWATDDAHHAEVAISTYSLIGQQWPEVAFNGLDYMMGFSQMEYQLPKMNDQFIIAVSAYIFLGSSGFVREIMNNLALYCSRFDIDKPFRDLSRSAVLERSRNEDKLVAIRIIFFLLTVFSTVDSKRTKGTYTTHLSEDFDLGFPNTSGYDVILSIFIASHETEFRSHIATVLATMIANNEHESSLELLKEWATAILQHGDPLAQNAFIAFLIDIGSLLQVRDRKLQATETQSKTAVFQNFIRRWPGPPRDQIPGMQFLVTHVLKAIS